ncbi:hypothetical protein XM38_051410 [Halomicronema hongdechloris C2206]|uniref:DUF2281 domain-containing protein n=1 Tax=Halomicronema hongdechloris C2206 TaxID=1641165 RepID=A0A1Z3HV61_9CYAN|nr:hypothetical protein XM38_051410 [Halomicronema hongdechloris C2206]
MPEFEQLRDDISTLPAIAQQLVVDFVAFLKQRYSSPEPTTHQLSTSKTNPLSACGAFAKHL